MNIKLLKHRIRNVKRDIQKKSPKNKCLFVQEWANVMLRVLGIPILDTGYKPYWRSYYIAYIMFHMSVLVTYTIFYYAKKSEHMKCLPLFCIYGATFLVN